jgi:hypothetical protein
VTRRTAPLFAIELRLLWLGWLAGRAAAKVHPLIAPLAQDLAADDLCEAGTSGVCLKGAGSVLSLGRSSRQNSSV